MPFDFYLGGVVTAIAEMIAVQADSDWEHGVLSPNRPRQGMAGDTITMLSWSVVSTLAC